VITTYLPLHAAPPAPRADFIASVCGEGLRRAASLARFADAFCEQGAYSVEECEQFLRAAREAGLGLKLHAEQRTRSGGAALAARMGAVSADHLEHASDADLRALAGAGTVGIILPGAALILGGPPPPGRRLLDAGARIAIASDCNPGTCWNESMPLMLSLAVATAGLTPAEALQAATSGGAAALALRDRGVLREGMRCDISILNSPRWLDVAYHLGDHPVSTVIRAGAIASS
jgi:imidazolonepropionase